MSTILAMPLTFGISALRTNAKDMYIVSKMNVGIHRVCDWI